MGYVSTKPAESKADGVFSRTRRQALSLVREEGLSQRDRVRAWEIAHRPDDLTAADAWAIRRMLDGLVNRGG